jgi:hypothetical protein
MEFEEEEVKPGIYLTRYGRKNQKKTLVVTPEEYRIELMQKGLIHPEFLRSERNRFENSVRVLRETNDELRNEIEFQEVVDENELVILRHSGYLQVLNDLLGESESIYL